MALVLGFIGVKMIAEYAGAEIPTEASLAVVVAMLGGVDASLCFQTTDKRRVSKSSHKTDPTRGQASDTNNKT